MVFSLNNGVCIFVAILSTPIVLTEIVRVEVQKTILSLVAFAREIQGITNFRYLTLMYDSNTGATPHIGSYIPRPVQSQY
jgi:hypothetical protein